MSNSIARVQEQAEIQQIKTPKGSLTDPLSDVLTLLQRSPELWNWVTNKWSNYKNEEKGINTDKWNNLDVSNKLQTQPSNTNMPPGASPVDQPVEETTETLSNSVVNAMLSSLPGLSTAITPMMTLAPVAATTIQMLPHAVGLLMRLYDQKIISDMYDPNTQQGRAKLTNAISNVNVSGHNALFSESMNEQINRNISALKGSGRNIEFSRAINLRGMGNNT